MIVKEKLQRADLRKEECFTGALPILIVILCHGINQYLIHARNATMLIPWKSGKKMKAPRLFAPNQNAIIKNLQLRDILKKRQ